MGANVSHQAPSNVSNRAVKQQTSDSLKEKTLKYFQSLEAPVVFNDFGKESAAILAQLPATGVELTIQTRPNPKIAFGAIFRVLDELDARKEAIQEAQERNEDVYQYSFPINNRSAKSVNRERFSFVAHYSPYDWCDCVLTVHESGKNEVVLGVSKKGANANIRSRFHLPSLPRPRDLMFDCCGPDFFIRPRLLFNPKDDLSAIGATATIFPGVAIGADIIRLQNQYRKSVGARLELFGGILAVTHSPGLQAGTVCSYTRISSSHPFAGTISFKSAVKPPNLLNISPILQPLLPPHRTLSLGWTYQARDGCSARGAVDSDGTICGGLDEILSNSLRIGLSAEANFFTRSYKWGMSMTVAL